MRAFKVLCILIVATVMMPMGVASAELVQFPLAKREQAKTNWCWATAAQIVVEHKRGVVYSQCQYFKWGKQSSTCEANEPGSFVAELPRAIKQGGVNAGTVDYAQTFSWIKTAIYNRNPPILRYAGSRRA